MRELITDLDTVRRLATERRDAFQVMQYMLERESISDEDLDALVDRVAAPIDEAIDCTQCANCCRSLNVYLRPEDVDRLADGVDIPVEEIETRYVDHGTAQQVGEWGRFKHKPCAFLDGKLCSVYPHRPDTCRRYPQFTPDFRWTLEDIIDGASICPIIYNVLEQMVEETERLSRMPSPDEEPSAGED